MKKRIALIIACICMLNTLTAFGAVEQISGTNRIKVSGNAGAASVPVAIDVFKGALSENINGGALAGMSEENYLDILIWTDQVTADGNGAFEFSFNGKKSGPYSVYLASDSASLPSEEILFINVDYFDKAINGVKDANDAESLNGINNAASAAEVKAVLSRYTYEVGLTPQDIAGINVDGLANVIYGTKSVAALDGSGTDKVWPVIGKALFVEKLNEGKISNIYDYEAISGLAESEIKDWYKKDYVKAELKSDFTTRMSSKGLASNKAFDDALLEAFILATVKYPDGYGNVRDIIKAFDGEIGVDSAKGTDEIWKALAGKDYADYGKLAYAFNNPGTIGEETGNTGTPGGFTGGGGGGGGAVVIEPPKTEDNPPPAGNTPGENTKPQEVFNDIAGVEWAKEAIVTLVEKGILSGDGDGSFRPNDTITRAEFCKIIIEAFLPDSEEADIDFKDVADDAWYKSYVSRAFGAGIAQGTGDGSFGVDAPISRQDMAVMVYNAMVAIGKTTEFEVDSTFNDDASIADYAKEAVYALKAMGAINGMTDGGYAPLGTATRAQAAKIVGALLSE